MIAAEWSKQWHRRRTIALLGAAALFPVVMTVAIWSTGSGQTERVGDLPLLLVPRQSGWAVPLVALSSTMRFFLPLLVAVVAGETVAGERAAGSLRYALARPVSRSRLLGSKALVAGAITAAAIAVLVAASIVAGLVFFGGHPLQVLNSDPGAAGMTLARFSAGPALGRVALSTAYVAAGMVSVFAFGLFLSTLTSRPIVAVAGAAALTVVARVFNGDYLPGIGVISKYTPNQDIDLWQHLFAPGSGSAGITRFLLVQVAYAGVFSVAGWWLFTRRDLLA